MSEENAIISDDEALTSPRPLKPESVQADESEIVGESLVAVVDIGSNGVRFSISSIAPRHARCMPCVFKDRLNVSLFESQYQDGDCKITEKSPIPNEVIYEVCKAMKRFQIICSDFGVANKAVRVVATEATREASNSEYFRKCIYDTTGWTVELLSKEDEGRIGSFGVISSFHVVSGLFLDLGGGSTQVSWIHTDDKGAVQFSKNPVSLPYGAAALTRRLRTENSRDIFLEIKDAYALAVKKIEIPQFLIDKAEADGGFLVFCSGGGLRGLGNLLLSQNPEYPIRAIINGYACGYKLVSSMANFLLVKERVPEPEANIFRVSERRKLQLPAVGLLISAAFESLPKVRSVHFSQGGVREGALFERLPRSIRLEDPLIVATKPYAPFLVDKYLSLVRSALPRHHVPTDVWYRIAPALCNLAFVHCMYPKELQPTAALHVAVTGIIAGSHGLSHRARALIGLALCERWGAELPESEGKFKDGLANGVLKESYKDSELSDAVFWTLYIGKIMYFISGIYPGGNISDLEVPFKFEVKVKEYKDKEGEEDFEIPVSSKHSSFSNNKTPTTVLPGHNDDLHEADNLMSQLSAAIGVAHKKQKHKYETIVKIDADNVKIGSGAGNRIKSIQKKIKKLARNYDVKLKFETQYVGKKHLGEFEK